MVDRTEPEEGRVIIDTETTALDSGGEGQILQGPPPVGYSYASGMEDRGLNVFNAATNLLDPESIAAERAAVDRDIQDRWNQFAADAEAAKGRQERGFVKDAMDASGRREEPGKIGAREAPAVIANEAAIRASRRQQFEGAAGTSLTAASGSAVIARELGSRDDI